MKSKPAAPLAVQVGFFTLIRLVLNTSYRMIYPYLSTFQAGLGVGLPAISIILSLRSLLGFAGPFLSPIADRRGRRVSMLLGLLVYTIGALVVVIFPIYAGFFASLLLMSLAVIIFLPAMQAYLGDRVAYARRGRVMGICLYSGRATGRLAAGAQRCLAVALPVFGSPGRIGGNRLVGVRPKGQSAQRPPSCPTSTNANWQPAQG